MKTILNGNNLHFVLDTLAIGQAISKADLTDTSGKLEEYFTLKKTRFLHALAKTYPAYRDNIVFWQNYTKISVHSKQKQQVGIQYPRYSRR